MDAPSTRIDLTLDMRADTPSARHPTVSRDPDRYSATLRRYHQLLRSKPLPTGERFDLDSTQPDAYLYHRSSRGELFLTSDGIVHTYQDHFPSLVAERSEQEREEFEHRASAIAGYTLFPGDKRPGSMTINQARGTRRTIGDRIDLTLECIRRHYAGESSPLSSTLTNYGEFFALFGDFPGYVDFFLLNDLVGDDYSAVRFLLPFDDFTSRDPRPKTMSAYLAWREGCLAFLARRTQRIADYARDIPQDFTAPQFERARPARLEFATDALDAAMDTYGVHPENRSAVREFVDRRKHTGFYIPPSRSYLGLRLPGGRRSDTVHVGYIEYWTEHDTREWFALPVNRSRD